MEKDSRHSPAQKKHIGSIIGFVICFGLLWIFITIGAADEISQLKEITWLGALGFGLAMFCFLFFAYFLLRSSFFQQFRFKSLKASMIYGICLASFFSIGSLSFNWDDTDLFLIFYSSGVIGGIFFGWLSLRVMKRKIVNDKIMIPDTFPENLQHKDYWKELVMLFIILGLSLVISREVFHSKEAWTGVVAGLFLGGCLYTLLWAYLYEKQNNLRLTFEYMDSDIAIAETES